MCSILNVIKLINILFELHVNEQWWFLHLKLHNEPEFTFIT